MPKVALYKMDGTTAGDIQLSDAVFGADVNHTAMYQVVKMQQANKRQGTQSTKTRSEVRGGGAKPWRQKGTGRARHGTTRSPIWIKGGVVFAPKPRDYRYSLPKKLKRVALKSALSSKVIDNEIVVLDNLTLEQAKTKEMAQVLKNLNSECKTVLVLPERDNLIKRASNNLPNVKLLYVNTINVIDVLDCDKFIVTKEAAEKIEEVYA